MDAADIEKDLTKIHYTEDQILAKLRELAGRIEQAVAAVVAKA